MDVWERGVVGVESLPVGVVGSHRATILSSLTWKCSLSCAVASAEGPRRRSIKAGKDRRMRTRKRVQNTQANTPTGATPSFRSARLRRLDGRGKVGWQLTRRHKSAARHHLKAGSKQTSRIFIDYRYSDRWWGGGWKRQQLQISDFEKKMLTPGCENVFEVIVFGIRQIYPGGLNCDSVSKHKTRVDKEVQHT